MVMYDLHTILDGCGRVTIRGTQVGELIVFHHPKDDESIVLQCTPERCDEIASMHFHLQRRMNLKIERQEMHTAREYEREELKTYRCPSCLATVTWICDDFVLHSIPWCVKWREGHPHG